MLREQLNTHIAAGEAEISVTASHTVAILIQFIDERISGFCKYYTIGSKDRENYITQQLVNYFNSWLLNDSDGYIPYKFSFQKNPAQSDSSNETDVGIFILNRSVRSDTILEFESKRLSDSSNNSEYVFGSRGGIERFKRNFHGRHLLLAGLFGYVQSQTTAHWVSKINAWITECSTFNSAEIEWSNSGEKLGLVKVIGSIMKYESVNSRTNNQSIKLTHYFINCAMIAG